VLYQYELSDKKRTGTRDKVRCDHFNPCNWNRPDDHNLYSSPDIIRVIKSRRMRWVGHVVHMGETRNAYKMVRNPEGKRPLGRPRYR
jgi:hypothetical protein